MQNVVFTQLSIPELRELIKEVQEESNRTLLQQLIEEKEQSNPKEVQRFLNKKEAAYISNVCTSTIDNWIRAGYIKKYKLGEAVRIKYTELLEYLDSLAA